MSIKPGNKAVKLANAIPDLFTSSLRAKFGERGESNNHHNNINAQADQARKRPRNYHSQFRETTSWLESNANHAEHDDSASPSDTHTSIASQRSLLESR